MNKKIIFFIITTISITLLLLISNNQNMLKRGVIKELSVSQNRIIITLYENKNLVLFETSPLSLKKGDEILYHAKKRMGREEEYIVHKIVKVGAGFTLLKS